MVTHKLILLEVLIKRFIFQNQCDFCRHGWFKIFRRSTHLSRTSDTFTLGLRGEIFNDDSGILGGGDQDNTSFTITGSFTSGNLTIKPEIRVDSASAEIYSKSLTDYTDNLASFILAAIYAF